MHVTRGSLFVPGLLACLATPAWSQPPPSDVPPAQPPPAAPPETGAPPQPQEPPPPPPETQPTAPAAEQPREPGAPAEDEATLEIYGFVMLDAGYDFGDIGDPLWQDVLRPTKLPAVEDQFGTGGRTFMGVRQTRFGVSANIPTDVGEIKSKFEWELFGVGDDTGQTTFRLRHAYGDWKTFRAGQTWSPFMDIDEFPDSIEYWGPPGMPFFRNVQVAWMPIQGDTRVTVALERPGASADVDAYEGRVELENVVPRFPAPDLSAEGRYGGTWGYVELAGILRWLEWDDLDPAAPDISGSEVGWGLHLSSNLKLGPALLRLGAVYGEAIENYMNDATADIGAVSADPAAPIDGEALPVLGLTAFADLKWSEQFTSTVGWSFVWIDNSEGQAPEDFHLGHYALVNLLYRPTEKLMLGPELQYGRRENNGGGFDANDFRIQFSAKYSFSKTIGGK